VKPLITCRNRSIATAFIASSIFSLSISAFAAPPPTPAPAAQRQISAPVLASTTAIPTTDLMQCYQKAVNADSQWKTAMSTYKADLESKKLGRSRLLPTATGRVRVAENKYKSNAPQINFNSDQVGSGNPLAGLGTAFDCVNQGGSVGNCLLSELGGIEVTDETDSEFSSEDYSITVAQPVFQMENWYDYQTGKTVADKAKADLKAAHLAMMIRVGEGYFKVLKAQDDERFVEREGQAIEQQARLSRRAYEQGIASETEYLETQVAVDSFMANREAAQGVLTAERQNYAAVTGEVIPALAPVSEDVPIEMPQPATADEWLAQARAHNAKLLAAEYGVKIADYDHRKAKAGHYPKVQALATYVKTDMHGGQGFTPASELGSIGLELQVPIYSGGYVSASRRQKLYTADKARDMELQQQVYVETAVRNLYTLVTAEMRRVGYRKRAVVTSNNALRATRKSYDDGTRTILDLLQAQNHYYSEQRELAHSRYEYLINTLKLKEAAGTLSEEDLKALNAWMVK
jgi:outer membrane protein